MKKPDDITEFLTHGSKVGKAIEGTGMMASVVTEHYLRSPECAMQLGFAILFNKPIFLMVDKKLKIPMALVKVAAHIERVDMDSKEDMARGSKALAEFSKGLPIG